MALTDHILLDSPTNNFATLNPLNKNSGVTLLDGNTKYSNTSSSNKDVSSTIIIPSTTGLWYIEFFQVTGPQTDVVFGFGSPTYDYISSPSLVVNGNFIGYTYAGRKLSFGTVTDDLTTLTVNVDVLTFCIDASAGKAWAGKNGVWFSSGDPSTGANPFYTFTAGTEFVAAIVIYNSTGYVNFGQDPTFGGNKTSGSADAPDANGIGAFYYQPPTGALALCTANLPEMTPDVADDVPQDYFKAVLYTGQTVGDAMTAWDGTTGTIECGFPVDFAWIKVRNAAGGHRLYDTVRGANQILLSNETSEERTFANEVTGFHSTGFYVGNGSIGGAGGNFVSWCWKAGGAPDLTTPKPFAKNGVQYASLSAANITAGTITPTAMSVNTDAGFSIVSYTGNGSSSATVAHGLGATPAMIIVKYRSGTPSSGGWFVTHKSMTTNYQMQLQANSAEAASYAFINGGLASPNSSSTFSFISGSTNVDNVNDNGTDYIAYIFAEVEGHSKFGSYTGNGSPDGPFVYCGFRPAFVMVKNAGQTANWVMYDNKRNTSNLTNKKLAANLSDQENVVATLGDDSVGIDLLSNGFKIRTTGPNHNNSNINYIFMAFAEQPFKYANAR